MKHAKAGHCLNEGVSDRVSAPLLLVSSNLLQKKCLAAHCYNTLSSELQHLEEREAFSPAKGQMGTEQDFKTAVTTTIMSCTVAQDVKQSCDESVQSTQKGKPLAPSAKSTDPACHVFHLPLQLPD